MREKIESLVYAMIPIGIFFIVPNIIAIILFLLGGDAFLENQPFAFTLIGYCGIMLVLGKLEKIYPVSNSKREITTGIFNLKYILLGLVWGVGLWAASAVLNSLLIPFFPNYGEEMSMFFDKDQWILNALAIVVMGPIVEEVIFRDKIYKRLEEAFGSETAIFIQGIMFGFVHSVPLQKIYTTLLGIGLGYSRKKGKTLVTPIIAHMTINAIGFIVAQNL